MGVAAIIRRGIFLSVAVGCGAVLAALPAQCERHFLNTLAAAAMIPIIVLPCGAGVAASLYLFWRYGLTPPRLLRLECWLLACKDNWSLVFWLAAWGITMGVTGLIGGIVLGYVNLFSIGFVSTAAGLMLGRPRRLKTRGARPQ